MGGVYRSLVALLFAALLAACDASSRPGNRSPAPEPRPRPYALERLLASRSFEAVALDEPTSRLFARSSDGRSWAFDLARRERRTLGQAGVERAFEPAQPAAGRALGASLPPGFEVAAVAADGARTALKRPVHPESDEIYLHERPTGTTRIVLPTAGDARFLPVGFLSGGEVLVLLTDEGSDGLRLERLDLTSGARAGFGAAAEAAPGCAIAAARIVAATRIAAIESCTGQRRVRLFDAETGAALPLPEPPERTRYVDWLDGSAAGRGVATAAGPRLPRDLLWFSEPGGAGLPLTWGLAPGIDPELLTSPETVRLAPRSGAFLPVELWLPRAAPPHPALVWVEDDRLDPAWNEFDPLFQFLAARGIAVARLRFRGAGGFGRSFRHAADGRPLEAAVEDLAAARAALVLRGGDPARIALVAEGGWSAAVAAGIAGRSVAAEPFVAIAALDADPDPLRILDEIAAMGEPALGWWRSRLGEPGEAAAMRARAATRAAPSGEARPSSPLYASAGPRDLPALWTFLEPHLATVSAR